MLTWYTSNWMLWRFFSQVWRSRSSFELHDPHPPRLGNACIASGAIPSWHWAWAMEMSVWTWAFPVPIIPQCEARCALGAQVEGRQSNESNDIKGQWIFEIGNCIAFQTRFEWNALLGGFFCSFHTWTFVENTWAMKLSKHYLSLRTVAHGPAMRHLASTVADGFGRPAWGQHLCIIDHKCVNLKLKGCMGKKTVHQSTDQLKGWMVQFPDQTVPETLSRAIPMSKTIFPNGCLLVLASRAIRLAIPRMVKAMKDPLPSCTGQKICSGSRRYAFSIIDFWRCRQSQDLSLGFGFPLGLCLGVKTIQQGAASHLEREEIWHNFIWSFNVLNSNMFDLQELQVYIYIYLYLI